MARLGGGDEQAAEITAIRASPANTPGPPQHHRAELRFIHFTIALLASKPMTKNVAVLRRTG
jgi:hypothetical protein